MGKKLTSDRIKQLEDNANLMKDNGYSDSDIQTMSNQFIDQYGVDETSTSETPAVKKKVDGKPLVLQSSIPSQNENSPSNGSLGVNDFYPSGFAPQQSETNAQIAKLSPQDKAQKIKDAYHKARKSIPFIPEISDEDLDATINKKLEKNPNVGDDIIHGVLEKEHRDAKLASSSADELSLIYTNKIQDLDNQSEFLQTNVGKASENIWKLTNGRGLDAEDAEYTKRIAPVAYNEALKGMDLAQANQYYTQAKEQNEVVDKTQQFVNQVNYLSNQTGIPKQEFGNNFGTDVNPMVDNLLQKQKANYDTQKQQIQNTYPPIKVYGQNPKIEGATYEQDPRYVAKIAELDAQQKLFKYSLGNTQAVVYANINIPKISDGTVTIQDVGMQSFKIQNPSAYQSYINSGSVSTEVQNQAWQLGDYALLASGNPELIKKAREQEKLYYAQHPKQLDEETIKRFSVEYYKQKGRNYWYNSPYANVSELDNIADQMPKEFKDHYYNDLRPKAVAQGNENSFNPNVKSGNGVIQLMNPQGLLNSFAEGAYNTVKDYGKSIKTLVGARSDKEKILENLDGTPITERPVFSSKDDNLKEISELELKATKKTLTPDEAKRYYDLKGQVEATPRFFDGLNSASRTVGMLTVVAGGTELGAVVVGKVIKGVAGGLDIGVMGIGEGIQNAGEVYNGFAEATKAQQIFTDVAKINTLKNASGVLNFALMTHDESTKMALELMPNDNQAHAREIFSATRTAMWSFLSTIFPAHKILEGFTPEIESTLGKLAQKMANGEIDKVAYQNALQGVIKTTSNFIKGATKDATKVTIEMTSATGAEEVMKYIANPNEYDAERGKQAVLFTLQNTYISMGFPILSGGIKGALNNRIGIPVLSTLFNEKGANTFKDVVSVQEQQKQIDGDKATTLRSIADRAVSIEQVNMPQVRQVKKLSEKEDELYKVYLLGENVLDAQIKKSTDAPLIAKWQKQIKESQDKRAKILDGEHILDNDYNLKSVKEIQDEIIVKKDAEAKKLQEEETLKTQNNETTNIETTDSEITATNGGQPSETQPEVATESTVNPNRVEVAKLVGKERKDFLKANLSKDEISQLAEIDSKDKQNEFIQKLVDEKQKVGDGSDVPKVVVTEPTPTESLPKIEGIEKEREDWTKEDYAKEIERLQANKEIEKSSKVKTAIDESIKETQDELDKRQSQIKDEPTLTKEIDDLEKERKQKEKEVDLHLDFETDKDKLDQETDGKKIQRNSRTGAEIKVNRTLRDLQNDIKEKQEILKKIKKCL